MCEKPNCHEKIPYDVIKEGMEKLEIKTSKKGIRELRNLHGIIWLFLFFIHLEIKQVFNVEVTCFLAQFAFLDLCKAFDIISI